MTAPRLPRAFWWLWTGVLVSSLATFVFPFLALYLSARGLPAERIGLLVSLLGFGALLAGPIGGSISDRLGRRPAIITGLIGSAIAAAYLGMVQNQALIAPGILVFGVCAMMTFPQFAVPIAMQKQGLGPLAFGFVLGTNCVYLLILQPFVVSRISKLDPGKVLPVASLLVGAGYGAYAFCTTMPQYLMATVVWSTGELLGMPAASAVVAQLAPEDLRGRYQGAYGFSFSVGMALAPILSGLVLARAGSRALWMASFAMGTATAALHFVLGLERRGARLGEP